MAEPAFRRVLLKLSGEILAGEEGFGIDPERASYLANEVKSIRDLGVGVGLIIGAGNIFRGIQAASKGMDRVTGDYLGMLATIMNAISLQDALEKAGCETRTLSAISVAQIAEPYIRRRAIRHLEKERIVIVAGGTGNPFFTTDKDPIVHEDALKYDSVTFNTILTKNLRVMDLTAITLCKENNLPIRVFNINQSGYLKELALGGKIGTLVSE